MFTIDKEKILQSMLDFIHNDVMWAQVQFNDGVVKSLTIHTAWSEHAFDDATLPAPFQSLTGVAANLKGLFNTAVLEFDIHQPQVMLCEKEADNGILFI
ncbi:hypothetical protein [uncultured Umboniibacter sp.]|uniref:hypothetical protein n=1 Tax=uncultured Umboniibacter sp. TaxID=1798917 RepID=UPI0026130AC4|nr:hypothetical protein [uncultured Umboniibacter sp.]